MHGSPRQGAPAKGPRLEAVKVGGRHEIRTRDDVTYWVVETKASADRRAVRRLRTRLRSGKILDPRNRFLVECQIYDRSEKGARLRLVADRPVPSEFRLFEDSPERLIDAFIVWREQHELGICFAPSELCKISMADLACLRGRYYAIGT